MVSNKLLSVESSIKDSNYPEGYKDARMHINSTLI